MVADILFRILELQSIERGTRGYTPRASNAGEPCVRKMTYLTRGEAPTKELAGRFFAILDIGQ